MVATRRARFLGCVAAETRATPASRCSVSPVPAAWIATEVLGGGVSSRLWRDVRERRGLAYAVGTGLTLHREAGVALVSA
ncbi:MAG TPA: insulinase family protein, partial [Thermoanaerobaculia bacterium]|nr:insulinase family protein [Thermoanaerobaculia bacterium]